MDHQTLALAVRYVHVAAMAAVFGGALLVAWLAWLFLLFLFVPVVLITAVLIISVFSMPAMVAHVGERDYPGLARRKGGRKCQSKFRAYCTHTRSC